MVETGPEPSGPVFSLGRYGRFMDWPTFVAAAESTGWITYLATADGSGAPHSSVVAPGFSDGVIWFGTRVASKKYRNLAVNPEVAFHWSVTGGGSGEVSARGNATLHNTTEQRRVIWESGVFSYDLAGFFDTPENDEMAFVECRISSARLVGPDFVPHRYP